MHLLYVHSTKLGYARYGVKLADALQARGVKISDTLNPEDTDIHNVACWIATPGHARGWFAGQRPIISTMWESGTLPEAFRETLHEFAQVIVPSKQNLELFSRYHPNVVQVPLGVDSSEWQFRPRMMPDRRFIFLIGGSGARKGPDLAYRAFKTLWPTEGSWGSGPVPTLIFKSPRPVDYWGPRIEHIGGHISDEAERDLYAMAHCYLQPSRGEGWGLQPLQAIAQGVPTILTDAHGQAEFAHLGYGISATRSKADYFIYGDAGEWWEPSLDELCQRMEYVYNNYQEACEEAESSSREAHRRFSWDRCADLFIDAVGRDHLDAPYTGSGGWYEPTLKRYLVRVLRPWRAEVAQTVYLFRPGEDYWETADIKRILFEQNILDPACVVAEPEGEPTEVETGLHPLQLAKLGDYSASHGHCEMCGQRLNTPGQRFEPEFAD